MRVLVVGAGVVGLTTAVCLAEAGYDVHVLARDLPLETTSSVAAALWYPFLADPPDRVLSWSTRSLQIFSRIARESPQSGVSLIEGTEVLTRPHGDPFWACAVPSFTRIHQPPVPYVDGWSYEAPVIEMPVYLLWLRDRLEAAGATITRMALRALPAGAELVVNCTGLGARHLAADASVVPVRGQVVRIDQIGLDRWSLHAEGPTYVIPRARDIVLGGTSAEGVWETRPEPSVAADIVRRATVLVPELAGARVLGHRVGLRPARPSVRLEGEQLPKGGLVVHCYGHGGAGVTLSWGCAEEVLALVASSGPAFRQIGP